MRIQVPVLILLFTVLLAVSCRTRKSYTTSLFEQQMAAHKIIAVLPAEMVFTGTLPKNLTTEALAKMEEVESRFFQNALYNAILRHAETRKYYTTVFVQDISTTQKILEDNQVYIRKSWTQDDKELAKMLGVDAVVRLRVVKKRYMSDLASMGIGVGQQVLSQVAGGRFWVPHVPNKTADLYVSCNLVSDHRTLWNDTYRGSSNYTVASETVVDNIADHFGRRFPYKKRR